MTARFYASLFLQNNIKDEGLADTLLQTEVNKLEKLRAAMVCRRFGVSFCERRAEAKFMVSKCVIMISLSQA